MRLSVALGVIPWGSPMVWNDAVLLCVVAIAHDDAAVAKFVTRVLGRAISLVGKGTLSGAQEVLRSAVHQAVSIDPGYEGVFVRVGGSLPPVAEFLERLT